MLKVKVVKMRERTGVKAEHACKLPERRNLAGADRCMTRKHESLRNISMLYQYGILFHTVMITMKIGLKIDL